MGFGTVIVPLALWTWLGQYECQAAIVPINPMNFPKRDWSVLVLWTWRWNPMPGSWKELIVLPSFIHWTNIHSASTVASHSSKSWGQNGEKTKQNQTLLLPSWSPWLTWKTEIKLTNASINPSYPVIRATKKITSLWKRNLSWDLEDGWELARWRNLLNSIEKYFPSRFSCSQWVWTSSWVIGNFDMVSWSLRLHILSSFWWIVFGYWFGAVFHR